MKKIQKFLLIILLLSFLPFYLENEYDTEFSSINERISTNNNSAVIYINNNWSAAVFKGICTGAGNYSDPYIIQDKNINATSHYIGILINNSDKFFYIENSSIDGAEIGIELNNVTHGRIFNVSIANMTGHDETDGNEGAIGTGIFLRGSYNNTILNNTIINMTGGAGSPAGYWGNATVGGIGAGIFLSESYNNTLANNTIEEVLGGVGGPQNNLNAADGGVGAGIFINFSSSNNIYENNYRYIFGGKGGKGDSYYSGGNGGTGSAIYLNTGNNNTLKNNTIVQISGGLGGNGGGGSASGGSGGMGTGIYFSGTSNNTVYNNSIEDIFGGTGGSGGTTYGSLGANGKAYGIYLKDDSYQNTISIDNKVGGDAIVYLYNKKDELVSQYILTSPYNPTNLGKISLINCSNITLINNTISNFMGNTGNTGGWARDGGEGDLGVGIYLKWSNNNTLSNNTISNITGGTGGTAGDASIWGAGGTGGKGALGTGIFLSGSYNNTLVDNNIYNTMGGEGGLGGGHGGSGGISGVGTGIYLNLSFNNTIYNNNITEVKGSPGSTGGNWGSGGSGSDGIGIYLNSSSNNNLFDNNIVNITGGSGGLGGSAEGADGTTYGIYLKSDSYHNEISSNNTFEGEAIVYLYNKKDVVIANYNLTETCNPTNFGKIALINCSNITLINNNVGYIKGGPGNTVGRSGSPYNGSIGAGIFICLSFNITIFNNTIFNITGGKGGTGAYWGELAGKGGVGTSIYLKDSFNNTILSNIFANITGGLGGSGGEQDGGGTGGIGSGIFLSDSYDNFLSNNTITNISGAVGGGGGLYYGSGGAGGTGIAIYLNNSYNNILSKNNFTNIKRGKGSTIFGGDGSAGVDGTSYGIYLKMSSHNNEIGLNNLIEGEPIIYLYNKQDMVIANFILTEKCNPTNFGKVSLIDCSNITLNNNTIANSIRESGHTGDYNGYAGKGSNNYAIYVKNSYNNTLTDNTISNITSGRGGPGSYGSHGGDGGTSLGIYLSNSFNNTFTNNTLFNISGGLGGDAGYIKSGGDGGIGMGIYLNNTFFNTVKNNTIINITGGYGVSGGSDGVGYGIDIELNSNNNVLFLNRFFNNSVNAYDMSSNNYWDNGSIGNYWDDYSGNDLDDDGIGDTPYNITDSAENQDNYPIWSDGTYLIIINPKNDEIFGLNAPNYTVEITDPSVEDMWYSLNTGENMTFVSNGTINQTEWEKLSDDIISITFYANETTGKIVTKKEIEVIKDTNIPSINLAKPNQSERFGLNSPSFTVEITDLTLDIMWYSLNNVKNITFISNNTINQTEWEKLADGPIHIIFYANDSLGNINSDSVDIIKDTKSPSIKIINPKDGDLFSHENPSFIVRINDSAIDKMWYSFNNGKNLTFISNGTINKTEWDLLSDGTYLIRFYANDTVGNINSEVVYIYKDTIAPSIEIMNPFYNNIFGSLAPNCTIQIGFGMDLNRIFYSLNHQTNTTFITNDTINVFHGSINQTYWDSLADGTIIITFYVSDMAGNINSDSIQIIKDTTESTQPIGGIMTPIVILGILIILGLSITYYMLKSTKLENISTIADN
ncbi:MAG: hypothetical protein EU551_02275 [Promethearchaeota archaeon]|nr:MAG: hypothetical protein EU551_02275 [Candidatus Lokiarchaeota archaeon]